MIHHTFQPWKIEGGKCVLLKDEWQKIRNINARQDGKTFSMEHPVKPPIVQVTADPFAGFGKMSCFKESGEYCCYHDTMIDSLFDLITECPNLQFWLATEHLGRVRENCPNGEYVIDVAAKTEVQKKRRLKNVTLFATVHNQPEADERIPQLLGLRELVGAIGVKYVPVGAVDFSRWVFPWDGVTFEHSPAGYCDKQYYPKFDHLLISWPNDRNAHVIDSKHATDAAAQAITAGVGVFNEFESEG